METKLLSYAQNEILQIEQYYENTSINNIAGIMHMRNGLEYAEINAAFNALVESHDSFRLQVTRHDGEYKQYVTDFQYHDYPYLDFFEDEVGYNKWRNETARKNIFELDEQLFKCVLLRFPEGHNGLFLLQHHLISDGWSMTLAVNFLIRKLAGKNTEEDARASYLDTIATETKYEQSPRFNKDKQFWLEKLENFENNTLFEKTTLDSAVGKRRSFSLSNADTKRIKDFCENNQISISNLYSSVMLILKYKQTLSQTNSVGLLIHNRDSKKEKISTGVYSRVLPMIVEVDKDLSITEYLNKIKLETFNLLKHRKYPYDYIVEDSGNKKGLLDCFVSFQNTQYNAEFIEDGFSDEWLDSGTNNAPLSLNISNRSSKNGLDIDYDYQIDALNDREVCQLHDTIQNILNSMINNPEQKISDIEIVTPEEKQQILHTFNDTARALDNNQTFVERFERQVALTPTKTAITYEGTSLSYNELNERANQLAVKLRDANIKPNDFVGIMTNRRLEMMIGIYGILKAGGAYVPIDPNNPSERINYILADSQPKVLLTDRSIDEAIIYNGHMIDLTTDSTLSSLPTENLPHVTQVSDLMYVIYTSGTTGKPKGVMVPYKGVINRLNWMIDEFNVSEQEKVLFKTPFTFDVSVWEIFGWAMVGGQAVLLPSGEESNPAKITKLIEQHDITMVHFVPSMLSVFIDFIKASNNVAAISSVNNVLASGEALKTEHVNRFNERIGSPNETLLIDLYGPTETSIEVIYYPCHADKIYDTIPIGKPIANIQALILNEDNNLLGIGVAGELCIGGVGVTDGYLKRPELTAEQFIDNPYGEGKLYRTGDLAKWSEDGNIEYIGRIDEQVKIRGYRIELGEIESLLRQMDNVSDVAVVAKPVQGSELAICAYLASEEALDFNSTKSLLAKKLPEYMIPSYMMQLEQLPVTTNGKLNKKALPDIKIETKTYVAPSTDMEVEIAKTFAQVLNVPQVSVQDSFFEIGGHSLRAISVINDIESRMGIRLPLKAIFEHPSVAQLATVVEAQAKEAVGHDIPQATDKPYYLTSSPQKRLYVLHEMTDSPTAYNMPSMLEIRGDVDITRVQEVFQTLVNRHEALRTHFETIDGEPVQVIEEQATISVDYEVAHTEDYDSLLTAFVRPFNLAQAPLLRVKIVKCAEQRFILLFDMHHIISDGLSINIIIKEFSALYQGYALEELKVQYKDYSEWMHTRDLTSQRTYWLEQFKEEAPVLDLPYDHARPNKQNFDGRSITVRMPDETRSAISQLAQTTGSTDYMILLTSFMVLLHKYSRQEDVVIGSPISGRTHKDTENMLGMFVNTLAMRGYPERNKSFNQLLSETKDASIKAFDNQEYPLEALVDEIVEKRDLTRNPLFDVLFTLQNNEQQKLEINNWAIEPKAATHTDAKFDLSMTIEDGEHYDVSLEYASELFEEATIQRMLGHFFEILVNITTNPEQKISDIDIVTESEKTTIFNDFNDTQVNLNNTQTFVERFEAQVAKTPEQTAIMYEGASLTYRELNERANQLARVLRAQGVAANHLVGLMTNRRLEMMIGIYGILKAGGAYVPVDPNYPSDRVNYILGDSQTDVLLTDHNLDASIDYDQQVINLTDSAVYENQAKTNLPHATDVTDLMYVIYTSGTTGKPKGVMVPYKGVMNRLNWMIDKYHFSAHDTVLFKTPFTFDVSVWEIFGWAMVGGQAVLLPSGEESNPEKIAALLEHHLITMVHFVPSMLGVFIDFIKNTNKQQAIASVNHVLASGEALKPEQVNQFNTIIGTPNNTLLLDLYGPTEASIEVIYYPCHAGQTYDTIPIGKPIANIQAYIMNEDNNLMGIGVPGELCIGGVGVTDGYLNRPDLTQEKFIDNPFGEGKLYRTGDLAKWSAEGNVEYLGRIDEQVKIRGYRIELGEIESTLGQVDGISDVAVIAKAVVGDELSICAYLVSDDAIDIETIKATLGQKLPSYMVPTFMTQLEQLPVTANGKLNKKALPDIKVETKAYVAPTTPEEASITQAFETVLHLEQVSVYDDFFEIGGHSLKAISVVNEIESHLGVRLPLKAIFENPTAAQLAKVVLNSSDKAHTQAIAPAEHKAHYYASSPQKRLYVLNEMVSGQTAYNMPSILEIHGNVDVERVQEAFQALIDRHESLRTHFEAIDGEPVQIINEQAEIAVDYEENANPDYDALLEDFVKPFDLAQAPLLRVKIVKQAEQHYILLFDMHHIISDGFSINLIMKEFSALYQNQALTPLTVQYKDYSEWMHNRDMSAQRAFWLAQFEEEAPVLDLPYDRARPNKQSFIGGTVSVDVPAKITQDIHQLAQETGSTDYMILLSSFMVLLHEYSRQEDIVIGSPISGRTHKDTESMLGMFVNTLAMRGYPTRQKTFNQLLAELKETSLQAFDNQEYPLEALVDEIVENRDLTRNPLFDVLFTLQNNDKQSIDIEDWNIETKEATNTNAKFDLNMTIEEGDTYKVLLEYGKELFDAETVQRMLGHYMEILKNVTQNPQLNIGEIEIITAAEQTEIFEVFNDTAESLNNSQTFVERFEAQVAQTPQQTAITYEGESLTYSELNSRANQLAYRLRELGVQPDDLVGLMTYRRLEMMVGIFGILKAGGAYVPVDPNYPVERIEFMLEDSQPDVLITDHTLNSELAYDNTVIDLLTTDLTTLPKDNLPHVTDVSNLMYVIYTSGTTGKPKGVLVPYEGVLNRLNWMIDKYNFDESDIILFKTPFTFDVSVWEIFSWAMVGGQAVLLPSGEEVNPEKIMNLIYDHHVTMVHFVPSMLGGFIDYIKSTDNVASLASLKTLLATGEALKPVLANEFNTVIGKRNDTLLVDLYGPTEASIEMLHYPVPHSKTHEVIPIGNPIANVHAHVINEDNKLMGIGVPGELCISGIAVTRGYLNRPELTAEKFIDNPFGDGKLYRTGDLAKWRGDGMVEYLGRMDEQVKIRGYRIELGEIESVLGKMSAITNVAVVAKPMAGSDLALCAYLVAEETLDFEAIKVALNQQLPEYMVPAYMMQLDALPVTVNGKLNKKSLPEIEVESATYIEPSNDMETTVAEAFETVLDRERVSIQDSFFEIGGDSIKAIKLTSLLSKSYNISIKDIFELQTVESISKALIERADTNIMAKLSALKEVTVEHEHRFSSDFMNEVNDYKEKSAQQYQAIDKTAVKRDKKVLLTGATGYFGIHVLKDLLARTDFTIYVMVRNSNELSGESKLNNNWQYYFNAQLNSADTSRIHLVEGNIEADGLGFATQTYDYLANNIDIIINAAANVNHFATEASSYDTNVNAINNIVDFAKDQKLKEIHHMSTMSIASGHIEDKKQVTFSEDDIDLGQKPNNVYLDGKIEAEKRLVAYRDEGVETNIYRLGNLQCDAETGIFQKNEENNAFYSIIKSFKKLQKFPNLAHDDVDFTPVDQAAQACNKLILNNQLRNETHHIYNNQLLSLKTLMDVYNDNNHRIDDIQWNDFMDYLMQCIEQGVMSDEINDFLLHTGILDNTLFNKSHFEILDYKTNFVLERLDFQWKPTSTETLEKMINHPKNNF